MEQYSTKALGVRVRYYRLTLNRYNMGQYNTHRAALAKRIRELETRLNRPHRFKANGVRHAN